jgi:hypothetical protein
MSRRQRRAIFGTITKRLLSLEKDPLELHAGAGIRFCEELAAGKRESLEIGMGRAKVIPRGPQHIGNSRDSSSWTSGIDNWNTRS